MIYRCDRYCDCRGDRGVESEDGLVMIKPKDSMDLNNGTIIPIPEGILLHTMILAVKQK
jgi:hypothetical protein